MEEGMLDKKIQFVVHELQAAIEMLFTGSGRCLLKEFVYRIGHPGPSEKIRTQSLPDDPALLGKEYPPLQWYRNLRPVVRSPVVRSHAHLSKSQCTQSQNYGFCNSNATKEGWRKKAEKGERWSNGRLDKLNQ
jgi:hypothetical protein